MPPAGTDCQRDQDSVGDFPPETVAPPASNVPANLEHPVCRFSQKRRSTLSLRARLKLKPRQLGVCLPKADGRRLFRKRADPFTQISRFHRGIDIARLQREHPSELPRQELSSSVVISAAMATRSFWSMLAAIEPCTVMLPGILLRTKNRFRPNKSLQKWVAAAARQEHICASSYRRVANVLIHENSCWLPESHQVIDK